MRDSVLNVLYLGIQGIQNIKNMTSKKPKGMMIVSVLDLYWKSVIPKCLQFNTKDTDKLPLDSFLAILKGEQ